MAPVHVTRSTDGNMWVVNGPSVDHKSGVFRWDLEHLVFKRPWCSAGGVTVNRLYKMRHLFDNELSSFIASAENAHIANSMFFSAQFPLPLRHSVFQFASLEAILQNQDCHDKLFTRFAKVTNAQFCKVFLFNGPLSCCV